MTSRLHCFSFHSVKGGVGKSTLSSFTACALANEHSDARVYLIDMDLTGTSLADVLPLEAPRWDDLRPTDAIDFLKTPNGFHSREVSRSRMKQRGLPDFDPAVAIGVPFLNDYLLFEPETWEEDLPLSTIAWRMVDGPANLHVFPSSALPRDLNRALPVIYDEEHAAFLEARLEYLLSAIVAEGGDTYVVFDTPPTIPGLSRSVLNLAFRLSRNPKTPLAEDGYIPYPLERADVDWKAMVVATQDMQDIRAAARWLELVKDEDQHVAQLVINRARGNRQQRAAEFQDALREPFEQRGGDVGIGNHDGVRGAPLARSARAPRFLRNARTLPRRVSLNQEHGPESDAEPLTNLNPILSNPIWIDEDELMQNFFRNESAPAVTRNFLYQLDGASLLG